ncbi:MAG: RtcB family protein [Candidatus Micrarchaeia archaeon]
MPEQLEKVGEAKWLIRKAGDMRTHAVVYGTDKIVEQMKRDRTFEQLKNVAKLPGIVGNAMVMPDGHEGYGFPIGGVGAFSYEEGIISPGGVGYDINCGVRLINTNIPAEEVRKKTKELINALFKNVPSGVGSTSKLRASRSEIEEAVSIGARWAIEKGYGWEEDALLCEEEGGMKGADPSKVSDKAFKRGAPQFGTLGAGNHFLEIQEVSEIMNPEVARAFGLVKGNAVVMLHCGSRGFGHEICSDYIQVMLRASEKYKISLPDKELCCAPVNSKEGQDYLGAMMCAVNFAFCNRQVMTHWIRETFTQIFGRSAEELGMHVVYDVCHNLAKIEEHEIEGKKMRLCVHRKGATRAFPAGHPLVPAKYREIGHPVLIPGSMGTASYVLVGTPQGLKETFGSTAHGSGRVMSRHEAIRTYRGEQVKKALESRGIEVKATSWQVISEEAPGAYKNVDDVVKSVELAGISKIVARLTPLGVAKG